MISEFMHFAHGFWTSLHAIHPSQCCVQCTFFMCFISFSCFPQNSAQIGTHSMCHACKKREQAFIACSRSGYIHDHFVIITPSHSCTGTAWYKLVKIRYFPNRESAVRQKIRRPAGSFSSDSWSARSAALFPAARNPAESYNRSYRSA